MSSNTSYIVVALRPTARRWTTITKKPLPRKEAALVVAAQWQAGNIARAIPATQ